MQLLEHVHIVVYHDVHVVTHDKAKLLVSNSTDRSKLALQLLWLKVVNTVYFKAAWVLPQRCTVTYSELYTIISTVLEYAIANVDSPLTI